jgi:flagellum-specific peptidoglycan hydrolase FlgJ
MATWVGRDLLGELEASDFERSMQPVLDGLSSGLQTVKQGASDLASSAAQALPSLPSFSLPSLDTLDQFAGRAAGAADQAAPSGAGTPPAAPEPSSFALPRLDVLDQFAPKPAAEPVGQTPNADQDLASAFTPPGPLGTAFSAGRAVGETAARALSRPAGSSSAPPDGTAMPEVRIDRSSPSAFLGSFRPAAEAALRAKGYPTSLAPILAAIPMNEQGWQKDAPGQNYFGIKGSNPRTGATTGAVGTWEDYGAGRTTISDTFRAYGSPTESVADFLDFLEANPRYGNAVRIGRETGDPAQFIRAVHAAGYATDPAWSDKILSIARQVPASTGAAAPATARQPGLTSGPRADATAGGLDVSGITKAYAGVPYTFGGPGGRSQGVGALTDCSGFVSAVWKQQYGLDLAAHTDSSYNQLRRLGAAEVSQAEARPGDVVYYMGAGTGGAITHHMGIVAGPGKVLDMSTSGASGVRVRDLGHAGTFKILRDPRVNQAQPARAADPPPIVPTGVAEQTGGEKLSPAQIQLAAQSPSPAPPPGSRLPSFQTLPERRSDPPAVLEPIPVAPNEPPLSGSDDPRARRLAALSGADQRMALGGPSVEGVGLSEQSYDPDAGPRELIPPPPLDPDAGPREATPGSVGAGPVGPLYGPEPAAPAPSPYDTDQPFRPTPRLGTAPNDIVSPPIATSPSQDAAPFVPEPSGGSPADDPWYAAPARAAATGLQIVSPTARAIAQAPETVGTAVQTAAPILAPALAAVDAANEWVINNPVAGALNLQGAGRELAGTEQLYLETREDQQRLESLIRRFRAGDTSVEPEIQALTASLNARTGMTRPELLAAGERNPDKTAETLGQVVQGAGAFAIAPGLAAGGARNVVGAALDPVGQGLGAAGEALGPLARGARKVGAGISDALASNARNVAAADARIAAEGSTLLPATLLDIPADAPMRAERGAVLDMSTEEARRFADTADAVSNGRPVPADAPVVWQDHIVRMPSGSRYAGDHPVSLPYYELPDGRLLPIRPPNPGGIGTPLNAAYGQAVKLGGGRKGFPVGFWTDARGTRHEFDSPQEVLAMHDLDNQLARGEISDWWRGETNPRLDLQSIPYYSTNRDKGGAREYWPDIVVEGTDGKVRVVEIKPAKVIAQQEDYGVKGGQVTGKMGWNVLGKAIGIIPYLAAQGAEYQVLLPRDTARMIPPGPGNKAVRMGNIPGLSPPDVPQMRTKSVSPEATSPGNNMVDEIHRTSRDAITLADRWRGQGLGDDEIRTRLTRMVRDRLLPLAELRTKGAETGQSRLAAVHGEAGLASWTRARGPQTLDTLDELDPDAARMLREVERHGARVTEISIEHAPTPGGAPRIHFVAEGDPQAGIRAAAMLGEANESPAVFWYPDTNGPHTAREVRIAAPPGAPPVALEQVQRLLDASGDATPHLVPRYNSGTGQLESVAVLSMDSAGNALEDAQVEGRLHRVRALLEQRGAEMDIGPSTRVEVSHFAGEPGHAAGQASGRERTEYLLGIRDLPRAVDAADAGGAGAGAGAGRAGAGDGAGAADGARSRRGRPQEDDDLDEDELEALASLLGPTGRTAGLPLGTRVATEAGRAIVGGMAGATYSQAMGDEEHTGRNVAIGAGAALLGPRAVRGMGRARGTLGTAGLVPEPRDPAAISRARAAERAAGAARPSGLGNVPPSAVNQQALPGVEPPPPRIDYAGSPNVSEAPNRPRLPGELPAGRQAELFERGAYVPPLERGPAVLPEAERTAGADLLSRFPAAEAELARRGHEPLSPLRWLSALAGNVGYSSMLGPGTLSVNVATGLGEPLWAIPKEAVRGAVRAGQTGSLAALREPGEMAQGALYGMRQLGDSIRDVIMGRGRYASNPNYPTLSERTTNPTAKLVAQATEAPGRVWSGLPDAIFGTIAEHAGQRRTAAQIATDKGLSGQAWKHEVLGLLEDARAVGKGELATSTEVQRVVDEGAAYAKRQAYRDELGTIGKDVEKVAKLGNAPVLGNWASPFFASIWNAGLRQAEKSPAGLAMNTQASRTDRVYDAVVGTAVIASLAGYGASGGVTGSGPEDPKDRELLREQGWRPYSTLVTNPATGQQHYIPNRVFGLFEGTLNAAGEMHDATTYQKKEADGRARILDAARRTGKVIAQNPYALTGVVSILEAGQQGPAAVAADLATRMTPFASTARVAGQALDTAERTTDRGAGVPLEEEVRQRWQLGTGQRGGLPQLQGAFGEARPNERTGGWALLPSMPARRDDPLAQALLEADVGVPNPPDEIDGVKLTPVQRRRYDEVLGREMQRLARGVVEAPSWKTTPPQTREVLLDAYRGAAQALAEVAVSSEGGPAFGAARTKAIIDKAQGR